VQLSFIRQNAPAFQDAGVTSAYRRTIGADANEFGGPARSGSECGKENNDLTQAKCSTLSGSESVVEVLPLAEAHETHRDFS
jgi:hypothetical protein